MIFGLLQRFRGARAGVLCLLCGAVLAASPVALHAKPLDKEACDGLHAEKQSLVTLGVDKEMAKGADWAKTNLPQARLDLVKRYLTVDEQLKFRCGQMLAALPPKIPGAATAPKGQTAAASIIPGGKTGLIPNGKTDLGKPATTPAAARGKAPAAAMEAPSNAATEVQGGLTVRAKSGGTAKTPAAAPAPGALQ